MGHAMVMHGGKGSDPNRHRYAVAFPGIARRMALGRTMPFEQQRAPRSGAGPHRRDLLRGPIIAAGPAVLGTAGPAPAQNGARPGLLHIQADPDRMPRRVPANHAPWISGPNRRVADRRIANGPFGMLTSLR